MVNPSIETLRAALSKKHIGLVEFIGVTLDDSYAVTSIDVQHSVVVQDFMVYCGIRGSLTTNWHYLLRSDVGETYDAHISNIVQSAMQWRIDHQCISIKEFRKGLPTNLHGKSSIISLELALHMGRFIGFLDKKERCDQLWIESGLSDEILVQK